MSLVFRLWLVSVFLAAILGCGERPSISVQGTAVDPAANAASSPSVPTAITFQHPIPGLDTSDYGLGFGSENRWFCMKRTDGQCTSYGVHLGRDTVVGNTPEGTEVFAPADGIVRVTTDLTFGGYGSDSSANPSYGGCVIVLEHRLGNGQAVTTLLGHVRCDGKTAYDAERRRGNPPVDSVVARGQYLARVGHYWHGSDRSVDWHHLHWSMRKGSFTASRYTKAEVLPWVQGYAPRSEFTVDPGSGALVHPAWLDPFVVVAGNGDPALQAMANVRHHPPGTLLRSPDGSHWLVRTDEEIASIPPSVVSSDRYDAANAIPVSYEEVDCYRHTEPLSSVGRTTLYVRPGSSAVVIAYQTPRERYDFVRWEALLSWGFTQSDIQKPSSIATYEAYASRGLRLLRPGTLVKADEETEVAVITMDQKRLPIISGDVFEQAGFKWERIVSLPQSVLDQVAGQRDNDRMLTRDDLVRCAVPPECPGGNASCGGGGPPGCEPDEVVPCPCADGPDGSQACLEDGQSFGPCVCTEDPEDDPPSEGVAGMSSANGGGSGMDATGGRGVVAGGVGGMAAGAGGASSGSGGEGGAASVPSMGGSGSGSPAVGGMAGQPPVMDPPHPLHLVYRSPFAGPLSIQGWWTRPDRTNRSWGLIDCPDANTEDDLLECDLPVESGSPLFEFQLYLPGNRYWGDQACDSGGCGAPLGTLVLTKGGTNVPVTFVPNSYGAPYYNGQLKPVP